MWYQFGKNWKKSCAKITLHGFSNFSESKSIMEIIFWIAVWLMCLILCIWLMLIQWFRYSSRPTVTTIKSTTYPISNIPFPAVSVCNSNVVHKERAMIIKNMLLAEGVPDDTAEEFLLNLNLLIIPKDLNFDRFTNVLKVLEGKGYTTEKLMRAVTHPCDKLIVECDWVGVTVNCSDLFRPVKTALGFCCAFNYLNDQADADEKFRHVDFRRVNGFGNSHALTMQINVDTDNYSSRIYPLYAAFVLTHPVHDYPDDSVFSIAIQTGDLAIMQVTPFIYQGDDSIRQLKINDRGCFFPNEGFLETSFDYTFTNCILECKAHVIYSLCKCVPYFYPILDNYPQCTLLDVPCLKKNELKYNSVKLTEKVSPNTTICQCLPQCEEENYDGSVNLVRNSMQGYASARIYFQHSWCTLYNQNLNMTWDMLLASLGGIFGLCLGGSLISLVEIMYFLAKSFFETLRERKKTSKVTFVARIKK